MTKLEEEQAKEIHQLRRLLQRAYNRTAKQRRRADFWLHRWRQDHERGR